MIALIDSDTPVYETALSAEDIELVYAKSRLDLRINNIIRDSGCSEYKLFVSGQGNFRKEIDPSYKANRTKPDPRWREDLRLHLIKEWGAIECNGYEADDACGMHQCSDGSTVICGIDKDLLQIPGHHYQWPIIRKGNVVREGLFHTISEEQGWRNLFTQVLTGDVSDNVKGVTGIGPVKSSKMLEDCHTEKEMYNRCLITYCLNAKDESCEEEEKEIQRFRMNCDILYIWRELGMSYSVRKEIYA